MSQYPTQKITVDYSLTVEEFPKLGIEVPRKYEASRNDVYECDTCRDRSYKYEGWECVRRGHSIRKSSRPHFETEMVGPLKIQIEKGVNSTNFPKTKIGIIDFQVTLFSRARFDDRNDAEFLEGIRADGYEIADIWQLVYYFKANPSFDYFHGIAGNSCRLVATECGMWSICDTGIFLTHRNWSKEWKYIEMVLAVKKLELNYDI